MKCRSLAAIVCLLLIVAVTPAQNQALSLQAVGTGTWIDVPGSMALAPASITFECWITYDDATIAAPPAWSFPTIVRKNFNASQEEFLLRVEAGNSGATNLRWSVRTAGGVSSATWPFSPGQLLPWTHVAGTYDGTTLRLFVNGAEVATGAAAGPIATSTEGLKIGAGDTAPNSAFERWNGEIDEVRLWSVARTGAEILANMFTPVTSAVGLEASWTLNGDALDYTGNGHNGTPNGTPTFVAATLPTPDYTSNSAEATLGMSGASPGGPFAASVLNSVFGTTDTVDIDSTLIGSMFDVGITIPEQLLPASGGAFVTPGSQIVNLQIAAPTLNFLFGGTLASPLSTPFSGPLSVPVSSPGPLTAAGQMVIGNPAAADGFTLSAGVEYNVVPCPQSMTVTLPDDGFVQVLLQGAPICGNQVSFYATTYNDIYVNSNGDVSFGQGHSDFTATSGEWQSNMPRIGIQGDLEPNNYGTVTVTNNGSTGIGDWLTIAYQNVTEWGTTGMGVTSYNIELHGPNGHEIGAFTTDGTWGTTPVVGGISLGSGGTHPPLVSFDALFGTGLQVNVNTTDSVIDENTGGMLANTNGWTSIQFPLFDGSTYIVQ